LERLVHTLAHAVFLDEELDLPRAVGDLGEARLAHHALEEHAAADAHLRRIGFEPFLVPLTEARVQLARERITAEIVGERLAAGALATGTGGAQGRELRATLGDQLVLVLRCVVVGVRHGVYTPALSDASRN